MENNFIKVDGKTRITESNILYRYKENGDKQKTLEFYVNGHKVLIETYCNTCALDDNGEERLSFDNETIYYNYYNNSENIGPDTYVLGDNGETGKVISTEYINGINVTLRMLLEQIKINDGYEIFWVFNRYVDFINSKKDAKNEFNKTENNVTEQKMKTTNHDLETTSDIRSDLIHVCRNNKTPNNSHVCMDSFEVYNGEEEGIRYCYQVDSYGNFNLEFYVGERKVEIKKEERSIPYEQEEIHRAIYFDQDVLYEYSYSASIDMSGEFEHVLEEGPYCNFKMINEDDIKEIWTTLNKLLSKKEIFKTDEINKIFAKYLEYFDIDVNSIQLTKRY